MAFRPLRPLIVRWLPDSGAGLQQVSIAPHRNGVRARGVVIGPVAFTFTIDCDETWATRRVELVTLGGRALTLHGDGKGRWRDGRGQRLPRFDGCIDVDLEGSPFTNTLPIRRLDLTPRSGRVECAMVYVPLATTRPVVDRQVYRCIAAGSLYGYEAADGSFAAEISVDRDGLVVDYPPLFHRAPTGLP
jgi:hypothetical protein